jgi:hypothetical protein
MARANRHRCLGTLLVLLGALLAVTVLLASLAERRTAAAPKARSFVTGALSVSNSRDGAAILTAANMAPGGSVGGTVTIRNTGTIPGSLSISASHLSDAPGPNGGALSEALDLRVVDTTSGSDAVVYAGKLGPMPELDLVTLPSGDARTYRFTATLPDGGTPPSATTADNAYQSASVTVDYDWTLAEAGARRCGNELSGDSHRNRLIGTMAGDRLLGKGGADLLRGRDAADCVSGGGGPDRLYGGGGPDRLYGGGGPDRLHGGRGADLIGARDGSPDLVKCGAGHDRAAVDRHDQVRRCEVVER